MELKASIGLAILLSSLATQCSPLSKCQGVECFSAGSEGQVRELVVPQSESTNAPRKQRRRYAGLIGTPLETSSTISVAKSHHGGDFM